MTDSPAPPSDLSLTHEQFEPEFSIVMPCLNEAETVGVCIERAERSLKALGVAGGVIVADNNSTDGSPEIAARTGGVRGSARPLELK
jgi:glycosyltransferase involved in cell wall biosynthesis